MVLNEILAASDDEKLQMFDDLVVAGGDINIRYDDKTPTLLYKAMRAEREDLVRKLLDNKVDQFAVDDALMLALER